MLIRSCPSVAVLEEEMRGRKNDVDCTRILEKLDKLSKGVEIPLLVCVPTAVPSSLLLHMQDTISTRRAIPLLVCLAKLLLGLPFWLIDTFMTHKCNFAACSISCSFTASTFFASAGKLRAFVPAWLFTLCASLTRLCQPRNVTCIHIYAAVRCVANRRLTLISTTSGCRCVFGLLLNHAIPLSVLVCHVTMGRVCHVTILLVFDMMWYALQRGIIRLCSVLCHTNFQHYLRTNPWLLLDSKAAAGQCLHVVPKCFSVCMSCPCAISVCMSYPSAISVCKSRSVATIGGEKSYFWNQTSLVPGFCWRIFTHEILCKRTFCMWSIVAIICTHDFSCQTTNSKYPAWSDSAKLGSKMLLFFNV